VFAAALPTHLAPAYVVCQDIDDVGFLAELLFQCGKLGVNLLVFGSPLFLVFFLQVIVGGVELCSE
jgi:hypothetical protein